jgi:hypothetical protein
MPVQLRTDGPKSSREVDALCSSNDGKTKTEIQQESFLIFWFIKALQDQRGEFFYTRPELESISSGISLL